MVDSLHVGSPALADRARVVVRTMVVAQTLSDVSVKMGSEMEVG